MKGLGSKEVDTGIYKKALGNLLREKEYLLAPPTNKNKMALKEYMKILHERHPERARM